MPATDALVTFLRDHVDENLRVVAKYDPHNIDYVWLRDDLEKTDVHARANALRKDLLSHLEQPNGVVKRELGTRYANVELRDDAVLLTIPTRGAGGVVASLEPEAARNLTDFVAEGVRILREDDRGPPET